jgi:outer membrane receptor protein involved in Fe transport
MIRNRIHNLILCTGLLSLCSIAVAAEAVLEEIVVTATKLGDMDIQTIPASIYAISGSTMEVKSQWDFRAVATSVPGLSFQDLGPGDMEFIIRGVNGNGPAVVGSYFGEYVITASDQQDGGGKNAPIKLVDMERVEVLNGPQGTLYGANSMAGNIRYIPRKADASIFDAFGDFDYADIDSGGDGYTVTGGINIPVIKDKLAIRLVAYRTDMDGWIDQPRREQTVGGVVTYDANDTDINSEETDGARVNLVWNLTDNTTFDLLYINQKSDIGGVSRYTAKGVTAWPDRPGYADLPGLSELTPNDDYINTDVTTSPREDDVELLGATLTFDTSAGSIVLSGSDYDHDIDYTFDSTPILLFFGVPAVGITNQPQSYNIKMLEGRFASSFDGAFNFVAGAYYQKEEQDFEVHVTSTDGNGGNVPWDPLDANDFFAGGTAIFGRFRQDEIEQKALFGEATYDFSDRWQIKAGLRWFDVELTSIQGNTHNFFGGANTPAGEIIGETVNGNKVGKIVGSEDSVNPMVALSYTATDDVMIYGLYSEGFRTGGVNNSNQPFASGIPPVYNSDELKNFELGIKSQFLDNRMQLNATLFHIDWNDIQVEPRDPAGNIPFTVNGGEAEINGIEWGLTSILTDHLLLTFTGTYFFKHELTTDQPVLPGASPCVITGLAGDDIPNVPDTQLYVSLQYDQPIGDMLLSLIGDVTYRSDTNTEFRPDNPFNIALDSYTQVDLFANLAFNERITVGVYAKNIGNEVGIIDGVGTFQDPEAVIALRPRTIGLRFLWRY